MDSNEPQNMMGFQVGDRVRFKDYAAYCRWYRNKFGWDVWASQDEPMVVQQVYDSDMVDARVPGSWGAAIPVQFLEKC